ncbi:unnamed protein product (macronuclear) [Paramecium tetraurelia]|uniref:MORN repeat protein n=1 Tax=Paramecium tetraurelia TaxID=5888 RepID=A0CA33_PARTE|nr:uncharacterized protein GSPATT00036429001 [Paramecium tetraurelia]CAK67650.1 unnamed protein product [Paramecium tetraurelia]|eukprot:XP_001435047.1 hypothetical protein (macronuclear) [Paramecium tetraurelia strain d4-2]
MISYASNQPEFLISKLQNQNVIEQEVDKWDYKKARLVKTKVQIRITSENNLIYSTLEGVVLRDLQREIYQDNFGYLEVLKNIEQIAHLQWHGEYGQNYRKLGKWEATWDGETLQNVGGYYQEGLKEGLWKEPIKNYWSKAQVFESGEYFHNKRQGRWNFTQQNKNINQTIGGGSYNEQAKKNGKWTELHEGVYDDLQVTWDGEYKNGQKVGSWNIMNDNLKMLMIINNIYSGGGSFGDGDGFKQGSWVELWNGFTCFSWVTENGEYQNGKKVGRWDMWYKDYDNKQSFKMQKKPQVLC